MRDVCPLLVYSEADRIPEALNVMSKKHRFTDKERKQILDLRAEKLNAFEISERLNLKIWIIRTVLKRAGVSFHRIQRGYRATWTDEEKYILQKLWQAASQEEICAKLPNRNWVTITRQACVLKLRRRRFGGSYNKRFVDPICAQLLEFRERQRLMRTTVAKKSGYHQNQILAWELGKAVPKINFVREWASALGYDLILKSKIELVISSHDTKRLMAGR